MAKAKVFVVYDDQGRIRATAVPSHEQTAIKPAQGLRVHAIDHPGLERARMNEYLRELHREHRVDLMGEPRIVRKNPKKD
jgi:hypothetical protein